MKLHLRVICLILAVTVLFYWKILLVRQYSLLLGYEGANQMYAWFDFMIATMRKGIWPAWDPFTFSGHSFAGEMQTGAFYPLYLFFLLFPFQHGVFSPAIYHDFFVLTHVLGALLMYALCRELNLRPFAGIVAGLCFSLGGFLARPTQWPHLLESGIWLPLILLLLLRAQRAGSLRLGVAWAMLSGLAFAMSVLAGGLHLVIMEGLVVVSATLFRAANPDCQKPQARRQTYVVLAVCIGLALAGGAAQLMPSAEYSAHALRYYGSGAAAANQRIPYASIHDNVLPQGLTELLFAAPAGPTSDGEYINPYMGVFPLLLAVIGVWGNWSRPWVRYLAGLFVAACLYSLGSFSWLNGLAYALVPLIWLAREPSRFMYLADLSLAILAGYGIETIFRSPASASVLSVERIVRWLAGAAAIALLWPIALGKIDLSPWSALSLLLVICSWALLRYTILRGGNRWSMFLVVALILFDLNAFDWSAGSINQESAK